MGIIKRGNEMIKTGDKGTIGGSPARVITDDLKGEYPLAIAITHKDGEESLVRRKSDGTSAYDAVESFIPSKPWNSLKPGGACFVKDQMDDDWKPRVYAGITENNKPSTFITCRGRCEWDQCIPAKLIDGDLVPVETAGEQE